MLFLYAFYSTLLQNKLCQLWKIFLSSNNRYLQSFFIALVTMKGNEKNFDPNVEEETLELLAMHCIMVKVADSFII